MKSNFNLFDTKLFILKYFEEIKLDIDVMDLDVMFIEFDSNQLDFRMYEGRGVTNIGSYSQSK